MTSARRKQATVKLGGRRTRTVVLLAPDKSLMKSNLAVRVVIGRGRLVIMSSRQMVGFLGGGHNEKMPNSSHHSECESDESQQRRSSQTIVEPPTCQPG